MHIFPPHKAKMSLPYFFFVANRVILMGVSTYLHLPREYNMGLIGLKKYQKIPSFIYVVVHQTFLQKKKNYFSCEKINAF